MRGRNYSNEIRNKCLALRKRGYSLNEIVTLTRVPKTTVHDWVSNKIVLSYSAQRRIKKRIKEGVIRGNTSANRASLNKFEASDKWSPSKVAIVAHFLFDGYPRGRTNKFDGYVYCSRTPSQLKRMDQLIKTTFGITAHPYTVGNGVIRHNYYSIKLANWIGKKKKEILKYIIEGSQEEKRYFLKAFFDDEGSINFYGRYQRRINGCQYSGRILKIIQKILTDFSITGKIDKAKRNINIYGRENLKKFQEEINFSSGIFMNPNRKGSYWKYKISKRSILQKAINSYKSPV